MSCCTDTNHSMHKKLTRRYLVRVNSQYLGDCLKQLKKESKVAS